MAKACDYWECMTQIRTDWTVCQDHYGDYADGKLDVCPGCGLLKLKLYDLCLPDHDGKEPPKGRKVGFRRNDRVAEHRPRYEATPTGPAQEVDVSGGGFHVYILKLQNGEFYAGYSEDLESRQMEHRDGKVKSTAGRDPRLVWFDWVSTKAQALALEDELQHLISSNPRRARRMVLDFGRLARLIDLNP